MFIKQLYTGCLSEAAYFIEHNGEAAIIDPLRDVNDYLQLATERNARIRYIFETHFHADFISGHIELSKTTGAPIIFGPGTKAGYDITVADDEQVFELGDISIKVLHTPGHTLESSCYLLSNEKGEPHCLFTGDTLFVGDVGRPDLAQSDTGYTTNDLAGMLYDSLQNKIMHLPGHVIIYPAHGPGSACGKNLGPNTFSTIADEKENNYALKAPDKASFIKAVTEGLKTPPQYFPINARINKEGYETMHAILEQSMHPLPVNEFAAKMEEDVIVPDTRPANEFVKGYISGSVFIGLEGRFAEWAGSLLPFDKPILLVASAGMEEEAIIRLARVGINKVAGYLQGGFEAWQKDQQAIDLIIEVEPDEMLMDMKFDEHMVIVDVRKETEFADGHLENALNLPLSELTDTGMMADFEETHNLYVHCAGGYRSVIAISLLKKQGIHNLRNITGGWNRIKEEEKVKIKKENSILN
jgi:glyoxylase-like metal-dependent hydrolase (beta-lactamase superfamily II)/rhodanese-related sulfurtransferase